MMRKGRRFGRKSGRIYIRGKTVTGLLPMVKHDASCEGIIHIRLLN